MKINLESRLNCKPIYGTLLFLLLTFSLFAQHSDPNMQGEHDAAMNLVPVSSATHTASSDGSWTSATTWNTGTVPGAGARVIIPQSRTVTYNSTSTAHVSWIRVDGTLRFATNQNTVLNVETIVVTPTGTYEQGTATNPIPANFTSIITFVDNGALTDSHKLARGLLTHGKVRIHGAALTPFLKTSSGLAAGATSATLAGVPSNWKVGDKVAITGMRLSGGNPFFSQDELKTITAISGSSITFDSGLEHMRKVDYATWGLYPYIANTSRNIQYKSANTTDHSRKGHVMFMHNPDVDVRYAGFYDLGRTRKDIPVTDAETVAIPTGDNPRGKYSLHFHRTGHKNASLAPAYVVGCAVVNSPGWAYVNHDSYVNFEDNVSYNAAGAHYVIENGAERGAFRRNIAIKASGGSNRHIKEGVSNHDLAHSGHGFWFQGGNYIAENNVASGCLDGGFTWFGRSNADHNGSDNQFVPANLLLDPAQAGGRPGLGSSDLPIMSNKNNTAYGCYYGMMSIDVEINGNGPTHSLIENFVTLNARSYSGIIAEYYRNFTFKNVKVLRDNDYPWNQWEAAVGIQAHNLIDHIYPFQTRSADRAINLVVRNYGQAVKNFEHANNDDRGEAVAMAKWQVIGAPVDHNCPNGAFASTATYNGIPLVQNIASEADILPMPTFSPAAGTYASTQTVTISSVSGATIYYVIGTQGWVSPSLEYQLKSGSWTQYTGPVTVSQNRKLIAIAVRNGQYSRINSGFFTIDPNANPNPNPDPNPGTTVTREYWSNVTGTAVSAIPVSTPPTGTDEIASLEGPTNWGDNYGTRIRAFIKPTTTGSYTFYIAGDDDAELWLSTDANPANKVKIASVTGWTNSKEWNKYPSQTSAARSLTANTNYYVEILHKEGGGGDNIAVGWTGPGISTISVIGSPNLEKYTTTPPPTSGSFNGTYKITARHSGKVLDVNQSSTTDGANVQQWTSNGSTAQQWIITATTDGYYRLVSKASGKALEVGSNSLSDGGNVQQWSYVGSNSQQWKIEATTDGYHRLINRHSGKALDVAGVSTADGANVHQWTYGGGNNQQWKIDLLSTSTTRSGEEQVALADVTVYPNPAKGTVNLKIHLDVAQQVKLSLTSAQGKQVISAVKSLKAGENTISVAVDQLAAGLYFVKVQKGTKQVVKKVIIAQ